MIKTIIRSVLVAAFMATPTVALADLAVGNGSSPTLNQSFVAPLPIPVNVTGVGMGSDNALGALTSTLGTIAAPAPPPGMTYLNIHIPVGASVSFYSAIGQAGSQANAQSVTQTYSNTASGATSNMDVHVYLQNIVSVWFTSITCGTSTTQSNGCPSYRWM
jgi:hypothetical protein